MWICPVAGLLMGCTPVEETGQAEPSIINTEQVDPPTEENPEAPNINKPEVAPTKPEQMVLKLQDVERRDAEGNIVGLLEEGLWYKIGEEKPYTGLVVGANKVKNGKPPVTPYNYSREFKDGVQVGKETAWYANGQKKLEMVFENGEEVSTRQWDADGNEIK